MSSPKMVRLKQPMLLIESNVSNKVFDNFFFLLNAHWNI